MRVAVAGSSGRMGRALVEAVLGDAELTLAAALEQVGHALLGSEASAACKVVISADVDAALKQADVLLDFTRPAGTLAHLEACVRAGKAIVIGTTGFVEEDRQRIGKAAAQIPIAMAPSYAVGVNVVFKLAEIAARALGDAYDVEIIEAHHRHKVDAPSGTALHIGDVVAKALGRNLADVAVHGREGDTGERAARAIGFHAIRGGDLVGEHTARFAGTGERVEITVRSTSRATYSLGALRAAKFLKGRKNGLYDMQDVLGLR